MAEDPSLLESSSAKALVTMREKRERQSSFQATPPRRGGVGRIRKPNPRIFGSDEEDTPTTPKPRKIQKLSNTPKSVMSTPDKRAAQAIGARLRNLLKLPKAHIWVCYEWFYSNIDKALFEGENDFCICLRETFPQLKTRQLTRVQWCTIRRLMGKPRRCSAAFFAEERLALERKRQKIRLLQQRKFADISDFKDLPEEIPMLLVIGTRVTARLRRPQDGLFTGVIDALDTANNSYRITFDRTGLGTHSVADIDVLSNEPHDTMPLSSFNVRKRPPRHQMYSPSRYCGSSSPIENDPLLGSLPPKSSLRQIEGDTLGGFPIKLLVLITRLTKLLGVKKNLLKDVKDMNAEAEIMKSCDMEFTMPFKHRYASAILELECLNVELNKYLTGVQQCWQEFDPEQGISLVDQPMEIRKKCQAEAEAIVKKTNTHQGRKRVKNERSLAFIAKLLSLLLQIRTFADSEMHSFEFKSLQDSLDEIRNSLDPSNINVFQNNVEIHVNHIQSGLTQTGNLQAFASSSSSSTMF